MPSTLPDGEPAPADGALPASSYDGLGERPFGVYVHVPFCATRCGYCDFNTYTATELGGGATQAGYAATAVDELRLARRVLGDARPAGADRVLRRRHADAVACRATWRRCSARCATSSVSRADAEVTTEANPDSVTPESLQALRDAGFTRVSFGMQSAVTHVLATLDRTHDPDRVAQAVGWARDGGLRGRERRPDLRHAGGVAGRLAGLAGRVRWPWRPTT